MRIAVLTREYPPEVYGGAGVHVTHLVEQLSKLVDVDVQCFGAPRDGAGGAPISRGPRSGRPGPTTSPSP